jgi:hypothetical protein
MRHIPVGLSIGLLCTALNACTLQSKKDEPLVVPVVVDSVPGDASVHLRVIKPVGAYDLATSSNWIYLGRTPFRGEAKIDRWFATEKEGQVQVRVTHPGYHAAFETLAQPAVDLQRGLFLRATLVPMTR